MVQLEDRVAVVTGGAQGIGLAVAHRLAAEGATVVIADTHGSADGLARWASGLRERCRFHRTDVCQFDEVVALVSETVDRHGRIDVLVNNASVFSSLERKAFHELDTARWEQSLGVNVLGTFHCVKAVFPAMQRAGRGKIINVATDAVFKGLPQLLDYVAAKGAVVAMTRALARELGPCNISVNAVAPGYTYHEDAPNWDPARNEQVIRLRCLKRTQTAGDVAGAIAFLASDDSDFITGQTIVVDGGEVML